MNDASSDNIRKLVTSCNAHKDERRNVMQIRLQLANPVLIFMYSLVLLLLGCAIGMHWSKSPRLAIWFAVGAALLMVIHDLLEGIIWFGITVKKTQALIKLESADKARKVSPSE